MNSTNSEEVEAILAGLTESQRRAVCHGEGPLLVLAGAGSGKTRVIIRRIAYLLSQGVDPYNIVAVTFTNKAATEMERRVEALVGEGIDVSTFHAFCCKVLRKEISIMDRDSGFSIYDRRDSLRAVRRVIKANDLDTKTHKPRDMLNRISNLKNEAVGPEEWTKEALSVDERALATIYKGYEEELETNNALDFDDLLLKTILLFREHPDVLQKYQTRYEHVLIDEYQDTNLPQHLIARALQGKHHNITAVGDPDQMIYGWRGARLDNMLEFEHDFPGSKIVKLERNYRSTGNILRAASVCISHNLRRHEKNLWTDREAGESVMVTQHENAYREADFVAEKVEELVEQGTDPAEIAVFYRTKYQSAPLEQAFGSRALPHQVVDSVGFFDRKEVKDLRAYLQVLMNPEDDEACLRIINKPKRGIGKRTQEKLLNYARWSGQSVLRAAGNAEKIESLGPRAVRAVSAFHELMEDIANFDYETIEGLIEKIIEQTEYLEACDEEDRNDAAETLNNLLGYAREYDERHPDGDLLGFLEQAALVSDVDGWNAGALAVPFMTLHSAKGLEFDVVFLTGVEDQLLPHARAVGEDDSRHAEDAVEEERRLLHVGMTRARKRLYLTHCRERFSQGRKQHVEPSRFLEELPEDCVRRQSRRSFKRAGSGGGFRDEMDKAIAAKRRARSRSSRTTGGSDSQGKAKSRKKSKSQPETPEGVLNPGQRVNHHMYGEGEVLEAEADGNMQRVKILFDNEGEITMVLRKGADFS